MNAKYVKRSKINDINWNFQTRHVDIIHYLLVYVSVASIILYFKIVIHEFHNYIIKNEYNVTFIDLPTVIPQMSANEWAPTLPLCNLLT